MFDSLEVKGRFQHERRSNVVTQRASPRLLGSMDDLGAGSTSRRPGSGGEYKTIDRQRSNCHPARSAVASLISLLHYATSSQPCSIQHAVNCLLPRTTGRTWWGSHSLGWLMRLSHSRAFATGLQPERWLIYWSRDDDPGSGHSRSHRRIAKRMAVAAPCSPQYVALPLVV